METFRFDLATPGSRFLSKEYPSDSSACLINETAVRKYNLEDPLNTILIMPRSGIRYGIKGHWGGEGSPFFKPEAGDRAPDH